MTVRVDIYTDGACRGNPGPGGWGAVLVAGRHRKALYGGERETTNNRMELKAAIEALRALKGRQAVLLHTDSKYLLEGVSKWLPGWKARGWKTAARKPVRNQDLWETLDALAGKHDITWKWVKGHSGHAGNDEADALANRGIDELY
ncbi:MAG: ribonuclease HI [Woeseiaceae bacterium]